MTNYHSKYKKLDHFCKGLSINRIKAAVSRGKPIDKPGLRAVFLITALMLYLDGTSISTGGATEEAVVTYVRAGTPIVRDDFENCQPMDKIKLDELVDGYWNIRSKDWDSKLLMASPGAPDITYNPKLSGYYDVYAETRAMHLKVGFAVKFSSDKNFVEIIAPSKGATKSRHFNVHVLLKKGARMDGEKIVFRNIGLPVYLNSLKFFPLQRHELGQVSIEHEKDVVIYRKSGRHFGFPGVTQAANGDILVVAREGRTHAAPGDFGEITLIRSIDNGQTWRKGLRVLKIPHTDLRDPSILCLRDGTILLTSTAGTMRSRDNGYTWDKPVEAPIFTPHGPVEDMDNKLIYVGITVHHGGTWIECYKSIDKGMSWQMLGAMITMEPNYRKAKEEHSPYYDEPHILISKDIWMTLYRMDTVDDVMTRSVSSNNGKNWSWPVKTTMVGHPPHLLRMKNGVVLCSYGYRDEPYGIRVSLSYDDGENWKDIVLRGDGGHRDLGYPTTVELADGRLLTVYYFNEKTSADIYIAGTFYRIK